MPANWVRMGCASSNTGEAKEPANKSATNGNAKGAGGDAGGGDGAAAGAQKQNPYMSLTPKDVFSLKMSWKGVRRSLEDTGVLMFTRY